MLKSFYAALTLCSALLLSLAYAGCSPDRAAGAHQRFDPLGGEYPQIMWMVNVFEADGPLRIGADGVVEHLGPGGERTATLASSAVKPFLDAAHQLPGYRTLAAPAVFSKPGKIATIAPGTPDKARASVGDRNIDLQASVYSTGEIEVTIGVREGDANATNFMRVDRARVAPGGAVALLLQSPSSDTWSAVVVRPSILRSVDDFPFQTAEAPPDAQPAESSAGEYPQILWVSEIYEASTPIEVTDDGRILPTTAAKPRGLAVVKASELGALSDSIATLTSLHQVAKPSLLTKVGQSGRVEFGSRDKAGILLDGRSLEVKGTQEGDGIRAETTLGVTVGAFSVSVHSGRNNVVAPGGALAIIAAGPRDGALWTLLVLRPQLIESPRR